MNFLQANRIAPDGTPRCAVSHLGLDCLPMSYKKDARLIRVNSAIKSFSYKPNCFAYFLTGQAVPLHGGALPGNRHYVPVYL